MSKKYFINNLNTDFGKNLLNELVKQTIQDPVHMCTMKDNLNVKPNGIKKILKRQKPKLFAKKATEQCEVFVYNIDETDVQDIQFGLEMMKKPFEDNKTFILVSDIMVWSNTERKVKRDPPVKVNQENAEQTGEGEVKKQTEQNQVENVQASEKPEQSGQNQQKQDDQDEEIDRKPIEYTFWEDVNYQSRVPLPKYEFIKEIEDKILAFKRQNVKIFIVCPGIIYGCGQNTFYPFFKAAWLQDPYKLPYLGNGDNLIPTIHLKDLVKFVIKLAESPPEQSSPYLLAFDMTKQKCQKSLIKAISQGIGSGQIESVANTVLIDTEEKFMLNIDIKPSKFFVGTEEQPAEFQWTSKLGIKQSIKLLLKDFCQKQAHRPMKLIFYQKQKDWSKESKIDYILERFSKYYKVPVLTLNKILQYAKQFAPEDLLQDLNEEWSNIMEYVKDNNERGNLDETMKVLYRVVRWRLLRNDCTNRGFILHNYPHFRSQLEFVFNKISMKKFKRKVPKKKKQVVVPAVSTKQLVSTNQIQGDEGNDNQNHDQENKQEKKEQVVNEPPAEQEQPAQPEEQQAQEEVDQNSPKVEPYYPESLIEIKRMGTEIEQLIPIIEFFISSGIQELVYDTSSKSETQIFESLRSHIERNGRPNNYLVKEEDLLTTYQKFIEKENKESLNAKQAKTKAEIQKQKAFETKRKNLAKEIIQLVTNEGQQEIKKMPFRNYLMEFVVPTLNEGLLEVSNIIPNDPVDLLAEYLYQKSYDV